MNYHNSDSAEIGMIESFDITILHFNAIQNLSQHHMYHWDLKPEQTFLN